MPVKRHWIIIRNAGSYRMRERHDVRISARSLYKVCSLGVDFAGFATTCAPKYGDDAGNSHPSRPITPIFTLLTVCYCFHCFIYSALIVIPFLFSYKFEYWNLHYSILLKILLRWRLHAYQIKIIGDIIWLRSLEIMVNIGLLFRMLSNVTIFQISCIFVEKLCFFSKNLKCRSWSFL